LRNVLGLLFIVALASLGAALLAIHILLPSEPGLQVELASSVQEVYVGESFTVTVQLLNEGGNQVKDVYILLEMPQGFVSAATGNSSRVVGPYSLTPYGGFGQTFTVIVSEQVSPGSYLLRVVVTADNMSPQIVLVPVEVKEKGIPLPSL